MRFLKSKREVVDFVKSLNPDEARVLLRLLEERKVVDDLIIYRLDRQDEKRRKRVAAMGMTMREYWRAVLG